MATLALLAAIWGSEQWVARAERVAIEGMGQWLLTLSQAMQTAIDTREAEGPVAALMAQQPPASVDQWQRGLKQAGFLVSAFSAQAPLPHQLLVQQVTAASCEAAVCPQAWLLLALPPTPWQPARRAQAAADLLVALHGKGLVVSELNPHQLQGGSFAVQAQWPLGTVGVLVWRSDVLPPFVRLKESRPVHLAGGLAVNGGLSVTGRATISEGLLLGDGATVAGPCAPDGLLLRSPEQYLLMCRGGRWQAWQPEHDVWQACLPRPAMNPLYDFARQSSSLDPLLPWVDISRCRCAPNYIPRWVGPNISTVADAAVTDGFLCEKS